MRQYQVNTGQAKGLDLLQLTETDRPTPAAHEVLVRWRATSLNYHDYLVAIGAIPVPAGRVPMSDGAGEVVAVGEGVEQWKTGDRVMSLFFPNWLEGLPSPDSTKGISGETINGYASEYGCVPATALTRMPKGYSFAEAATLPCAALTAWRGLFEEGQVQSGQKVLIEGTGGMSIFGLQLARAAGATVYATTSAPEKAEKLKSMGAEAVVNYKEDERWGRSIAKASQGGVHISLDVGGGSTMQNSIDATAMNGHIISIGILGGGRKGTITFPKFFFKHQHMHGIAVGNRAMQRDMVRFIEAHELKPIVDRSFAFEELAEAFRYQESGKHFGKIVVVC
ncbi:MAG TPA: NAD(P)-dependent alcohol dehydrogenase [Saprospiraceae bacterium]|nr:NAD(P)-dependent alcohol dehydrogenase [Saprospiraceae bacterium]